MGQVLIRNLNDAVIRRQRRRARRKGISLEQHLRDVISDDAGEISKEEWLRELDELRARQLIDPAPIDSVALIREGRDELDAKWR